MSGKSEHAKAVAGMLKSNMNSGQDDAIWGFIEGYSAYCDGLVAMANSDAIPAFGIASNIASILYSFKGKGPVLLDNPYFIGNGHGETDPSAKTAKYLKHRGYKDLGAKSASIAGAVGSVWTQVDVAGIGLHGNSVGSTACHLKMLADMARKSRKTGTVANWLELVIKMKVIKMTCRTSSLVGAAVPIPAVGLTTGIMAAAVATGAKLTLTKACSATALELHWRAKQEQFMSGSVLGGGTGGSVGPASRILWELFTKRGITRLLGKHDIAKIVNEPAGWMAIKDKLLLI